MYWEETAAPGGGILKAVWVGCAINVCPVYFDVICNLFFFFLLIKYTFMRP